MKKASELLARTCNFVFKAAEVGGICPAGHTEITQHRDYAAQRLHSAEITQHRDYTAQDPGGS